MLGGNNKWKKIKRKRTMQDQKKAHMIPKLQKSINTENDSKNKKLQG